MSNGKEVLVVVSKLKTHVKQEGGLNTAGNVGEALSDLIRQLLSVAIENAKKDGRKTLMDRDLPQLPLHQ